MSHDRNLLKPNRHNDTVRRLNFSAPTRNCRLNNPIFKTKSVEILMFRVFTIIMICILGGAEVDLFTPSFPDLQKVFNLSPFMVQLTLSVNFIAYCICSLFAGTLGDRYSKRSVILWSLAVFVLGSLLCVFANHYFILILGRFLQGIGISGPAVLGFVVIADEYSSEKQSEMMGVMNGIITLAMAGAPVLGSYINYYFNWRGNFVLLLALGLFCLVTSYFAIPNNKGNSSISLSPATYLPLLRSDKLVTFVLAICFLVVPYWLFIGMAPILYMKDFGVPLRHFGFYQGALCIIFAITSMISPKILRALGQKRSLQLGMILCLISGALLLTMGLLDVRNPLLITCSMLLLSIGAVFPVNILYPLSLDVVKNSKSRAAALVTASRLIVTAVSLEVVSLFYNGSFLPISIAMVTALLLGFWFVGKLFRQAWISHLLNQPVETATLSH
jgi:DHA1 family bicyclomycin/chloramphenicol resistance-like MFS transporter